MQSRDEYEERPKTINMLLDIDQFTGYSDKRLGPSLITLLLAGAPVAIYAYLFIGVIPFYIFLPLEIIWSIEVCLKVLGEESKRLEQYKRQVFDVYSSSYELLNIKNICEDGMVEYNNGMIEYLIVVDEGKQQDPLHKAQSIKKFLSSISTISTPDIYVQNISAAEVFRSRYSGVKRFKDPEVMREYVKIIDYNINIVETESLLTKVIFAVKARRQQFARLKQAIFSSVDGVDLKVYKDAYVADELNVKNIISRDLDTYVDYEELLRNKFKTGEYYGSRVLSYDKISEKVIDKKQVTEERGFMCK